MNDLLARHINDLKTVRGAREAVADVAGEAPLGDLLTSDASPFEPAPLYNHTPKSQFTSIPPMKSSIISMLSKTHPVLPPTSFNNITLLFI